MSTPNVEPSQFSGAQIIEAFGGRLVRFESGLESLSISKEAHLA